LPKIQKYKIQINITQEEDGMNVTNSFTEPHHTYRLEKEKGTHVTHTHTPEKKQHPSIPHSTYETREQQQQEGGGMESERKKERRLHKIKVTATAGVE